MRKIAFLTIAILSSVALLAQEAEKSEVKGAHPWEAAEEGVADGWSPWSLVLDGGINFFDGDFNSEMKNPLGYPTVGLALEYSFTPTWSLGVGYSFAMPRVAGNTKTGDNADILLKGMMHRVQAYVGFDLINAWFSRSQKKIFSANALLGGGATIYKNDIYYPESVIPRGHTGSYDPMSDSTYRARPHLLAGIELGFNLSRSISLGVKGTYTYFMKDDIDGRGMTDAASKNNDGMFDLTLALRYKINAVKKTHAKNVASESALAAKMVNKNAGDQTNMGDVYQGSGLKDTVVIYHRDTIVIQRNTTQTITTEVATVEGKEDNYFFIYFDPGKSVLNENGLTATQQIASRLKREQDQYAEIIGYCDNTGSDQLNNTLGKARAQVVTDELIEEYDINPSRIISLGRGKIIGKRSKAAYGPNRRAEVRLVSKEEFDKLKQQYREEAEQQTQYRRAQQQEVRQQKQLPAGMLDVVNLPQNTTLSKLARKYYRNTYCWVFIYEANREFIPNPNAIEVGTELQIPELTDEQLRITKDQAVQLLQEIR